MKHMTDREEIMLQFAMEFAKKGFSPESAARHGRQYAEAFLLELAQASGPGEWGGAVPMGNLADRVNLANALDKFRVSAATAGEVVSEIVYLVSNEIRRNEIRRREAGDK